MPESNFSDYSPSPPEQAPIDANMLRFHDAVQRMFADPEDMEASLQSQREQLQTIITGAKRVLPGGLAGEIEGYGAVVDFVWFGPGVVNEVPAECEYDGASHILQPLRDTQLASSFHDITTMLRPHGLDELIEERKRWFEQNETVAVQAFSEYVSATPIMEMLDSFRTPEADSNLNEEQALNRFRRSMEEFMGAPEGGIYLKELGGDEVGFKSQSDDSWFEEPYPVAHDWVSEHCNSAEFAGEVTFLSDVLINVYKPGVDSLSQAIEDALSVKVFRDFIGDFTSAGYSGGLEEALILKQLPGFGDEDIDGPTRMLTRIDRKDMPLYGLLRRDTQADHDRREKVNVAAAEPYDDPTPEISRILHATFVNLEVPHPEDIGSADLVVRAPVGSNWDPYIPGYHLKATDRIQGLYYMDYSAGDDPCLPNNVINGSTLSRSDRRTIERRLSGIGLSDASEYIGRLGSVTIADLARVSRMHGRLTYRQEGDVDLDSRFDELEDFKRFVKEQRINATSELFTRFGQVIAMLVKPQYTSGILPGYRLRGGQINAVKYSQLVMESGKYVGITDWTPEP